MVGQHDATLEMSHHGENHAADRPQSQSQQPVASQSAPQALPQDPRTFLKTLRDEEEEFLRKLGRHSQKSVSSNSTANSSAFDFFGRARQETRMDRKLRQNKPRLLLMGQRRSGKSSITSVVFHKMPPTETLFLESTTAIQKDSMKSFMDFQVWDFPGQLDYFDPTFDTTSIFSEIGALVWVIDAQDDYGESLNRLTVTILNLQNTFPHINVEVFVHKIDSLNDEFKADVYQDIVQRVGDELSDAGYINPNITYHLTSIYDLSIFEAFSKVIQKLVPNLNTVENLIDTCANGCAMEKAYLFDIMSKIYIASDTKPLDMDIYEMCSGYIDLVVDITDIYGHERIDGRILGDQMEETESSMTISVDRSMIYLKEINRYLCLVAYIKQPNANEKKGLIDYNVHVFQEAVNRVFAREWEIIKKDGEDAEARENKVKGKAKASLEADVMGGTIEGDANVSNGTTAAGGVEVDDREGEDRVTGAADLTERIRKEDAKTPSASGRLAPQTHQPKHKPPTYMQSRFNPEAESLITLVGDVDGIDQAQSQIQNPLELSSIAESTSRRSLNPRIQFLRLSAIVRGRTETPGNTPPYQPAAPSLLRPITAELGEGEILSPAERNTSPLRNLAISACLPTTPQRSLLKPNAIKMPQTGFQALILCGPGIGLSTFTSVPAEFPKALVEIANRPMVWYVLDWCYRMGVTDITLITPPTAKESIAAALGQNPYLTTLPSPSPDLLAPSGLDFEDPTAKVLQLPEVQAIIKSDFVLLPCDLICDISGDVFLETYFTRVGALGGVSKYPSLEVSGLRSSGSNPEHFRSAGGLSIWYNTADREESVKGEEPDFMCTTKLSPEHDVPLSNTSSAHSQGILRNLVWTMPMSELWEKCEEDKSFRIRQSLLRTHGAIKCMTKYRDSHIYFFPQWVKDFARLNEDFESVSEDLVGTWAKSDWRNPRYRAKYHVKDIFGEKMESHEDTHAHERPIEDEIDLLSLSSTQISTNKEPTPAAQRSARLASRVQALPDDVVLSPSSDIPRIPPILSYILPSAATAPLVRRVDTTPLVLSVSLTLAKIPAIDECAAKSETPSPFAHASKVHATATIAPRVTISRNDTLIDANTSIATQCVIKNSVIGSGVVIGQGARITGCVVMNGATVGEKCVLTGTVIGKRATVGKGCSLTGCEVQDANVLGEGVEGKGEKYLVGGLEDEAGSDFESGEEDDGDDGDGEGLSLGV